MGRIDLDKLDISIKYVDRIINGKNPVNNIPIEEESILANQNVLRCMNFIKVVLEEVKKNDGFIGREEKKRYNYPFELFKQFEYESDKTINNFLKQLNEPIRDERYKKISHKPITTWLKQEGYLKDEKIGEFEISATLVTDKGKTIGLRNEKRTFDGRDYVAVVYNQQAQEFIVANLEEILM